MSVSCEKLLASIGQVFGVQMASGSFLLAMDAKEMFKLSSLTNALLAESLISVEWEKWEKIACCKFPWSWQNCFSGKKEKMIGQGHERCQLQQNITICNVDGDCSFWTGMHEEHRIHHRQL